MADIGIVKRRRIISPANATLSGLTSSAAEYQGPGDLTTFSHWYGLRGYDLAYSDGTNPSIDIVDQAGNNPLTVNITSTGALDIGAINTWVSTYSVTTIYVSTVYDQVGALDFTQSTHSLRPTLTLSGLNGTPEIVFDLSSTQSLYNATGIGPGDTSDISICALGYNGTSGGTQSTLFGMNARFSHQWQGDGTIFLNYGVDFQFVTCSDSVWHSINTWYDNSAGTCHYDIDGSTGTTSGTASLTLNADCWFGSNGSQYFTGKLKEIGSLNGDLSSYFASIRSNQTDFWGALS